MNLLGVILRPPNEEFLGRPATQEEQQPLLTKGSKGRGGGEGSESKEQLLSRHRRS